MSKIIKRDKFPRREGKKQFVLITIQYEFPEELWRVIKEYAGVYDVKINWDVGLDRLTGAISNIFSYGWSNTKKVAAERMKAHIKKWFWNGIRDNSWKGLEQEAFKKKEVLKLMAAELEPKEKKKIEVPQGLKAGQDIITLNKYGEYILCKVIRLNKLTCVVQQYKHEVIEGEKVVLQTHTYVDNINNKISIVDHISENRYHLWLKKEQLLPEKLCIKYVFKNKPNIHKENDTIYELNKERGIKTFTYDEEREE